MRLQELFTNKAELMARNADEKAIKAIRKKICLRSRYLRNEHFRKEAKTINTYAINKERENNLANVSSLNIWVHTSSTTN